MRTNLNVPFADRYAAKRLGAHWDAARKTWFVPDAVDLAPFLQWVPGVKVSKKVAKVLKGKV